MENRPASPEPPSSELLRLVTGHLPAVLWTMDRELRFTSSLGAGLQGLGLAPNQVVGVSIYDFFQTRDRDFPIIASHLRALAGEPQTFESNWGGNFYHTHVEPLRDGPGGIIGVIGIALDTTERRKAEDDLKKNREQLLEAQRVGRVGSYEWDLDRNSITGSEEFYRILGSPALAGAPPEEFFRLVHPEDLPAVQRFAETSRAGGERHFMEFRLQPPDGTLRRLFVQSQYVAGRPDRSPRVIGVIQDVTERRKLEEQLLQAQRMEAMGRLAGGVAHDFNNLLTVMAGYGQLLLQHPEAKPALREFAQEIANAAERAEGLTRQLLAFSRKQVLVPSVIDLNAIVAEMDRMLRRLIGEDVDLVTVLQPSLGPVLADPGQIEQVVLNLAVNARDAMPGGGRLTIETADKVLDESYAAGHPEVRPGRYVMVAVSDTGTGIPKEILPRLFEPFFTTKEQGKGTGLGLSTVYGIVSQSGGHVTVYSEPGRGAAFKVYLPRVDAPLQPRKPGAEPPSRSRGTETILVVEDDLLVRQLVREVLGGGGYPVIEAPKGADALEIAKGRAAGTIHLLLTDMVMPGLGGADLAKAVTGLHPGIRVLFMSGYTENGIVHHGRLDPGTEFLAKPFTPDALLRRIRSMLDAPPGGR